jgi:hypothetical protein
MDLRPEPFLTDQPVASLLERVVGYDSTTWILPLLIELRNLETTGQNIPGVGDLRIAQATADRVRRLLAFVPGAYLPAPTLAPFSGGGLSILWNIGNKELSFTAYPEQDDFVFLRADQTGEIVEDGVVRLDQRERLLDIFLAFLNTPAQ